jgi:GDP-4-dehydro-6-deoxy-D-mannose reductase
MSTDGGKTRHRLLVFGSGFIAAAVVRTAADHWGWQAACVYRHYRNPALEGLPCYQLPSTVAELTGLIAQINPTDIIIALGSSFVPDINRNLDNALAEHLNGTMLVLDAVSRLQGPLAGKIIVIGSASEYGEFGADPVGEQQSPLPRDHYGLIKLSLRHVGLHYQQQHGLPVIHVRQFNVTGAAQSGRFVLPSICRQIAQASQNKAPGHAHSIVAGNTSVWRDFLAIEDVCTAYRTLLLSGIPGEVYNVCSGRTHRIADLIALAAEIAQVQVEVEVSTQLLRENDKVQSNICGDPSKLMQLGWSQQVQMRELIAQMIKEYSAPDQTEGQHRATH